MPKETNSSSSQQSQRTPLRRTVLRGIGSGSLISLGILTLPTNRSLAAQHSWQSYQETKLHNPDPSDGDYFGRSNALSRNGSTSIIGVSHQDTDKEDVGAAYIFEQQRNSWDSPRTIKLPNPEPEERDIFGGRVTVDGTGSTVAATAILEDVEADTNGEGAAYVFEKENGEWQPNDPVTIPNPRPDAYNKFGTDIELNTAGNRLLVGAPSFEDTALEDDDTGRDRGRVYLFSRSKRNWDLESPVVFQNPEPDPNDSFGWDISLSGNGETVLVGAGEAPSGEVLHAGEAYVFSSENGSWNTNDATALIHPEPKRNDYFGREVTLSHDGQQALVGAPLRGSQIGKAYLFRKTSTGWETANPTIFPNPDPERGDHFGRNVSFAAGGSMALIGSVRGEYVYERTSSGWSRVAKVVVKNHEGNSGGNAVLDGTGSTILAGQFVFTQN